MIFFNDDVTLEGRHGEIIELAKSLSLQDVCQLINLFAPNIHVFDPAKTDSERLLPTNPACMNGFFIQINVDSPEWSDDDCPVCRAEGWPHHDTC